MQEERLEQFQDARASRPSRVSPPPDRTNSQTPPRQRLYERNFLTTGTLLAGLCGDLSPGELATIYGSIKSVDPGLASLLLKATHDYAFAAFQSCVLDLFLVDTAGLSRRSCRHPHSFPSCVTSITFILDQSRSFFFLVTFEPVWLQSAPCPACQGGTRIIWD